MDNNIISLIKCIFTDDDISKILTNPLARHFTIEKQHEIRRSVDKFVQAFLEVENERKYDDFIDVIKEETTEWIPRIINNTIEAKQNRIKFGVIFELLHLQSEEAVKAFPMNEPFVNECCSKKLISERVRDNLIATIKSKGETTAKYEFLWQLTLRSKDCYSLLLQILRRNKTCYIENCCDDLYKGLVGLNDQDANAYIEAYAQSIIDLSTKAIKNDGDSIKAAQFKEDNKEESSSSEDGVGDEDGGENNTNFVKINGDLQDKSVDDLLNFSSMSQRHRMSCPTFPQYCMSINHDSAEHCIKNMKAYYGLRGSFACPSCYEVTKCDFIQFMEKHKSHLSQYRSQAKKIDIICGTIILPPALSNSGSVTDSVRSQSSTVAATGINLDGLLQSTLINSVGYNSPSYLNTSNEQENNAILEALHQIISAQNSFFDKMSKLEEEIKEIKAENKREKEEKAKRRDIKKEEKEREMLEKEKRRQEKKVEKAKRREDKEAYLRDSELVRSFEEREKEEERIRRREQKLKENKKDFRSAWKD